MPIKHKTSRAGAIEQKETEKQTKGRAAVKKKNERTKPMSGEKLIYETTVA